VDANEYIVPLHAFVSLIVSLNQSTSKTHYQILKGFALLQGNLD
jgi:hypothetical protein